MKLDIAKEDVWAATMQDRPGALNEKLEALAAAGANLGFVIARRDTQGTGVVFATPIKGAKQIAAARKAGFKKTDSLHGVCVAGTDKPGLGAALTKVLAEAGINLRGLSAAALGRKCIAHLAFDSDADAKKAVRLLKAVK